MGGNVLKKLRSSKGASITFALLAFLVCAVISAVLLASASAASGRASDLAKMDQRYYAVTSAAQLFCDKLDGQQFTIERKKVETKTVTTTYSTSTNEAGEEITNSHVGAPSYEYVYSLEVNIPGETTTSTISDSGATSSNDIEATTGASIAAVRKKSFLTDATLSYILGKQDNLTVLIAYTRNPRSDGSWVDRSWDIDVAVDGLTDLAVTATAKMTNNGTVTVEFKNKEATEKNPFKILVTLTLEVDKVDKGQETMTKHAPTTTWGTNESTTVTETDYIKNTKITWKVSDVIKVYGNATEGGS